MISSIDDLPISKNIGASQSLLSRKHTVRCPNFYSVIVIEISSVHSISSAYKHFVSYYYLFIYFYFFFILIVLIYGSVYRIGIYF